MPTQAQLDLAKKYWYTQEQINQDLANPWSVKRSAVLNNPNIAQPIADVGQISTWVNAGGETLYNFGNQTPQAPTVPTVPTTTTAPQPTPSSWGVVGKQKDPASVSAYLNTQPWFKTNIVGNTVQGTKNGVDTTWEFNGADWVVKNKPTIATTDTPVIGNQPATTPAPIDFTTATPEQLKAQYMTIGTKLPWEVTDEDRRFAKYLQTRIGLGETMDTIFGTKTSKSSGTTQFSTELVQPWENILSSTRNPDGTYNVVFKDWTSQTTTSEPSTTVFPEWTPEYYAQKAAQENQKRVDVLSEQLNTEAERRKKETADLVAKYGENIATQFQTQKADIEANGAKRMDALNTGLSFSGFGRSTLALEKRDEIAKNIETTINQAKAKADLELMAYRMEQEWADQVAIAGMRKNIADVQATIDDANYENQLEIIKLNQENATTGSEAMNNLLETISNSAEIVSNADLDKSQELGYFVDKNGALMLDSQKRPIQFEGTASWLTPDQIKSYSDAISKWVIKAEDLDKTLTPAQKADILKDVAVQNGTYTPPTKPSGQTTMAKIKWKTVTLDTVAMDSFQKAMAAMPENTVIGAQQYRTPEQQAKLKAEWKSWTLDSNHMKGMAVDIYDGDPSKKPSDIQIQIMNQNWWFQDPVLLAKGDYGHFDYKGVGWGTGGQGGQVAYDPSFKSDYAKYNKWSMWAAEKKLVAESFGSYEKFVQNARAYWQELAVEQALPQIQSYIQDLEFLKNNLSAANRLSAATWVWDYWNRLENITNKTAFQELTRLKEQGATFGALSEKEFGNIGSSTEIGKLKATSSDATWAEALNRLIAAARSVESGITGGNNVSNQTITQEKVPVSTTPASQATISGNKWTTSDGVKFTIIN